MNGWGCALALTFLSACQETKAPAATPFEGYRLMADGSYHATQVRPAYGFYVVGNLVDERFVPSAASVDGEGEVVESGTAGWMELSDGSFHANSTTGPSPARPYLPGIISVDGVFSATGRRILK